MTGSTARPGDRLACCGDEFAAITGLSRDLHYDQMCAGKLAYLKVDRRRIITRQHLKAFLTQTRHDQSQAPVRPRERPWPHQDPTCELR